MYVNILLFSISCKFRPYEFLKYHKNVLKIQFFIRQLDVDGQFYSTFLY